MNGMADKYFRHGSLLAKKREFARAIKVISEGLRLDPDVRFWIMKRLKCNTELKMYSEALQDADRLIELDPDDVVGYVTRGNILTEMGLHDDALDAYNSVVDRYPIEDSIQGGRKNLRLNLRSVSLVTDSYSLVFNSVMAFPEAFVGRARALRKLGRLEDAVSAYKEFLEIERGKSSPIAAIAEREMVEVKDQLRDETHSGDYDSGEDGDSKPDA